MKFICLFVILFSLIHITLQGNYEVCMQLYLSCERNCRYSNEFKSQKYFTCEKKCLNKKFECDRS